MRGSIRRSLACVLLLGAASAACSLTDLGGLTGGSRDAGAGSDATIDGGPDAALDSGGPGDSGLPDAARFCDGTSHAFCADFDEGTLGAWDRQILTDPMGTLTLSTTRSLSMPAALFASLPRRPATKSRATQQKAFAGPWRRILVDLDIYLEQPAWQTGDINAALVSLEFLGSANGTGLYFAAGNGYTTLGGPKGSASENGKVFPTDRWVHAHLDYDPAGAASATVDGRPYAVTFPAMTAAPGDMPRTEVGVGVNGYNAPAPVFNVTYDNVTVDFP